jgi:hypothetical protein
MGSGDKDKGKVDTLRPAANTDGADMYSTATVVRTLPAEFVAMMQAADKAAAEEAAKKAVDTGEEPTRISQTPIAEPSPRPAPRSARFGATPKLDDDVGPSSVPIRAPRPSTRSVARPPSPWQKLVPNMPRADAKPVALPEATPSPVKHHLESAPANAAPDMSLDFDTPPPRQEIVDEVRPSMHERPTAVPTGDESVPEPRTVEEPPAEAPTSLPLPPVASQVPAAPIAASGDLDADDQQMMSAMGRGKLGSGRIIAIALGLLALGWLAYFVLRGL